MSSRSTHRLEVRAGGVRQDYAIHVGRGLLADVGALACAAAPGVVRWAVISDETVGALYGEGVQADVAAASGRPAPLFTFPAGEAHKNRHAWAGLTDALLGEGLGRDAGIIALGGGVTGDLAGFVAATYLRGIPVVQVPTSVVAMVDSSVGGKTGVDTPAGKNLVGAFHPPAVVVIDPDVAATLPRAERAQGLAEAVKHGAIVDANHFDDIAAAAEPLLDGDADALGAIVLGSVAIKADVVARDEREGGLREILNFGHTLGHALEAMSGYALPHGSAVALGMVLEARLGERLGITQAGTADRLSVLLERLALPITVPVGFDAARGMEFMMADKKVRDGRVRVVLLEHIGRVAGDAGGAQPVDEGLVRSILEDACMV